MNDVLHANIFFFITSISVIVLTLLLAWAMYYVVGILKNLRDISDRIDRSSLELEADVRQLRSSIHEQGVKLSTFYHFFKKMIESFGPKKKK